MKTGMLFVMDESEGLPKELWDNWKRLYTKIFRKYDSPQEFFVSDAPHFFVEYSGACCKCGRTFKDNCNEPTECIREPVTIEP